MNPSAAPPTSNYEQDTVEMGICTVAPHRAEKFQAKLIARDLARIVSLNPSQFRVAHCPSRLINLILFPRRNDQNAFGDVLAAHFRSSAALAICGTDVFLLKGLIERRILGKFHSHSLVEGIRFRTGSR
jgi:hypothetical protein